VSRCSTVGHYHVESQLNDCVNILCLHTCAMRAVTRGVNLDSIQIRDRLSHVASFIQNLNYGVNGVMYGDIAGAVTCGIVVYAIIRPVTAGLFEVFSGCM
jgi:hypothetical protein